ncbi:hypothetical protein OV207_35500 [Corallococcus sp. BB11-1]|uniref:hypothetical protein n=1 Tax=Corallococcus sp. BB11-1 TaxID=2996783 RepID=UPI002271AD75|nr:hypothetical protein [Corallococcus sp. BB11-1]MCY1036797.1 hypothetical protein [Corallococcus sp. BB11-1]
MPPVSQTLDARMQAIATASAQPLYADPFWSARYGEQRARRFGDEDAVFHVRYLVQALDAGRPAILEDYARWLRTLLVTRGMCSRHLDQHFQGLLLALQAEGLGPDTLPGIYVQAARDALRHPTGAAGRLEDAAPAVVEAVAQRLKGEAGPENRTRLEEETRLHLSYLSDALALERADLWEAHLQWYEGFWPQRGLAPLTFPHLLGALKAALGPEHAEARTLLARAPVSWEELPS